MMKISEHSEWVPFCGAQACMVGLWFWLACGLWPGAGAEAVFILVLVWAITLLGARTLGLRSRSESWALIGAMALIGLVFIANLNFFYSHPGASTPWPYLANVDCSMNWALMSSGDVRGELGFTNSYNYPILMRLPASVLGLRGVLGFNALAVMLTICLCGFICHRCCSASAGSPEAPLVSSAAMAMLALSFNFLMYGAVLLKDALVCCSIAALTAALLVLRKPGRHDAWFVLALIAAILGVYLRSLMGILLPFVVLAFAPWGDILHGRSAGGRIAVFASLVIVSMGTYLVLVHTSSFVSVADAVFSPDERSKVFSASPRGSVLQGTIDSYKYWPLWHKVLALPLTMGMQLLLPLPWTFLRHFDYGPGVMLAHFGLPLYLFAGLVLYFFIRCLRKAPRTLALTAGVGTLLFAAIAFTFGGTVSRYAIITLPLVLPSAAWTLIERPGGNRSLIMWMGIYTLLLAGVLAVGWHMYSLAPAGNDILC